MRQYSFSVRRAQTIRLQFKADRELIGFGLSGLPAFLVDLGQDAKNILHVMAKLVDNNVRFGEITGCVETGEGEYGAHRVVLRGRGHRHGVEQDRGAIAVIMVTSSGGAGNLAQMVTLLFCIDLSVPEPP